MDKYRKQQKWFCQTDDRRRMVLPDGWQKTDGFARRMTEDGWFCQTGDRRRMVLLDGWQKTNGFARRVTEDGWFCHPSKPHKIPKIFLKFEKVTDHHRRAGLDLLGMKRVSINAKSIFRITNPTIRLLSIHKLLRTHSQVISQTYINSIREIIKHGWIIRNTSQNIQ